MLHYISLNTYVRESDTNLNVTKNVLRSNRINPLQHFKQAKTYSIALKTRGLYITSTNRDIAFMVDTNGQLLTVANLQYPATKWDKAAV